MNGTKILGSVVAAILASSLTALVACNDASHDKQETVPTAQAVSAASVQISIQDSTGKQIGTASGTLIAPQLVLTAAHNLAGQARWSVTSADGKQTATSARSMTYDWMTYDSDKAHPRRHDIGVIHLDQAITLAAYPKLVSAPAADGVQATRVRGINGSFVNAPVLLNKVQSSPNAWLGNSIAGETLDTGGAVYNDQGILGVISGQGTTTGKLYIAQVSNLDSWLEAKVACAGGSSSTDNYEAPAVNKTVSTCTDGGTTATTNGSGSGSGAGSSPNGGNSNGSGNGGTCANNTNGNCSGLNCGTGGTNGQTGDDDDDNGSSNGGANGNNGGSAGSGSGNGTGNGGTNGTTGAGGDNGNTTGGGGANGNNGSAGSGSGNGTGNGGTNGTTGAGGDNGSTTGGGGANGNNGGSAGSGSGNGTGNGGANGTTGAGGSNGNASGSGNGGSGSNGGGSGSTVGGAGSNPNGGNSGEVCQGADDNSDICPPEPTNCSGPTCGGGVPDDAIDYGNCACSGGGGVDIVVK